MSASLRLAPRRFAPTSLAPLRSISSSGSALRVSLNSFTDRSSRPTMSKSGIFSSLVHEPLFVTELADARQALRDLAPGVAFVAARVDVAVGVGGEQRAG